ncbi:hypothetical protein ABT115_29540 [Streptomyces sp. NPDC001832]|uniref:hypothetical protein n=1 Tax=Streptomyces sp. NPDC001832 TaxID=3154527 RepID=UPI003325EB74
MTAMPLAAAAGGLLRPSTAHAAPTVFQVAMKLGYAQGRSWADASDGLREELPNADLARILDTARWNGAEVGDWNDGGGSAPPAGTVPDRFQYGFAWDTNTSASDGTWDRNTARWYPQGVTTSFDGYGGTVPGLGRDVLVVSWYGKKDYESRGARVTFVDVTGDPVNPKYQHVLLVEPRQARAGSRPTYRPVEIHAGGMAWVGNFLYIANRPGRNTTVRRGGMSVFDITKMVRVTGGAAARNRFGYQDGKYYAYGYDYVLPLHHIYENTAGSNFQHSQLSLDRTQGAMASIVSSEYRPSSQGHAARWNLAASGYIADGSSDESWMLRTARVQGAVSVAGRAYYSANVSTPGAAGQLWVQTPRDAKAAVHGKLSIGPEDLSYTTAHGGSLWGLGEHVRRRRVYRVGLGE